ncbi:MAG: BatA domain-containing protein [Bacteroidia bacterium]
MNIAFLNPAWLWGLFALAVPIIVHFFNLQRPRQVLFSNVALVKAVKKTVVRRVRFMQWLLLLLRLLAVAMIVLAFANPVLRDPGSKVRMGSRSVAIVLDNSYSTTASNEKGAYFQQGLSLARNIIKSYSRQDEFLVMTSSDLRLNHNFAGQDDAQEALRTFGIEQRIRPHTDILDLRSSFFARSGNPLRELYFISDFQRSTVLADSQQIDLGSDSSLLIKYVPLATRPQRNVFVSRHQIRSQILMPGKPVEMSMTLVNDGETPVRDLSLRVLLEGEVVAISNFDLDPRAEKDLVLSFTPKQTGWLGGYVELDDNPIDFDNRRYFTLYMPTREPVLVVENQPSANVRILYEKLFSTQFETKIVAARNLPATPLGDYRSIVLVGLTDISSGLGQQLAGYVQNGGSLLIFPGEGMNLAQVNAWLKDLRVGSFGEARSAETGLPASVADMEHPVFKGMFAAGQEKRSFDAPLVYRYLPLTPDNGTVQNRILSLENQSPILLETQAGQGLVYTFALYPGDEWTDLHVKTLFTPLMFRLTQLMNQTRYTGSSQETGTNRPLVLRTQAQTLIILTDEAGQQFTPEQRLQNGYATLTFDRMELVEGIYRVQQGDSLLEKIAFNVNDQESRLAFATRDDLAQQLRRSGYGQIEVLEPSADAVALQIQEEKEGTSLWRICLWIVLLALVAEALLLAFRERPAR